MGTVPASQAHTIACERQKGEQACLLYLQTPRHLCSAQVAPVYLPGGMRHSALPLQHGSLPARYPGKWGKNHGRRNGFLTATSTQ